MPSTDGKNPLISHFLPPPHRLDTQGKNATARDKAASTSYTSQLNRELNDATIQVRVVQGYEPRHFLKIFKGKMIAYTTDDSGVKTRMFRVRGTCADDVRADELKPVAASLASDDVFIVRNGPQAFIWNGLVSARSLLHTGLDVYAQLCYCLFSRALRHSKKRWLLLSLMLLLPVLMHK